MNTFIKLGTQIANFEEYILTKHTGCEVKRKSSLPLNGDSNGRPPAPKKINKR